MSKKCYVTLILEYCVIRSGWRSFPSTLFTVKDLIKKMKEEMGSLARDTLAEASTSSRSRI
jgi:hypothetical protein